MLLNRLTEQSRIDGHIVLTEAEEEEIITEALEENEITVSETNHKKLKYYTLKVETLFKCGCCDKAWSSHMGTIVIDLIKCKPNRSGCRQRCKNCDGPEGWASPKFTEGRFKKVINRVITKYWERKNRNDDDASTLADDNHWGNPQAPHEQSLCERCINLGRPCW